MSDYTEGPWVWSSDGTSLMGADDQVLSIDLPEFIEDDNKVLIAAAPDLLAACRSALAWRALDGDGISDPTRSVLLAAITKAEGK